MYPLKVLLNHFVLVYFALLNVHIFSCVHVYADRTGFHHMSSMFHYLRTKMFFHNNIRQLQWKYAIIWQLVLALLPILREVLPRYVDADVGKQVLVVDKDLTHSHNSSHTYSAHLQHLRRDVSAMRLVLFPVFDQ